MGRAKKRRIYGRKFPYIRKFISAYTKKYFRICGIFFLCARKFSAFRTASFFPAEGAIFLCGRRGIFQGRKVRFPSLENIFPRQENFLSSEGKWIALGKKKDCPSEGKTLPSEGRKMPCARREISFRKKKNFLAEENIFSCGRKFCALPTAVIHWAQGGRKTSLREAGHLAQRRTKRKGWLRSCEASPSSFEAGEGEGDCPPGREGVATTP